jgi:hypothetical protein
MEEYHEDTLDAIEKERLRRQRARLERIGNITNAYFDKSDGKFHYELVKSVESGIKEERTNLLNEFVEKFEDDDKNAEGVRIAKKILREEV